MKNQKGITLISLIITIIVMIIIIGISARFIYFNTHELDVSMLEGELDTVSQAVFQQYNKYLVTNSVEELVGEVISINEAMEVVNEFSIELESNNGYYRLNIDDLNKINIYNTSNVYIVNYFTGEVMNESKMLEGFNLYKKVKINTTIEDTSIII